MFSTCLFCHGALGTNEVIEHFPVGRRLAFDADQGRLWVVCRKCERWNLTPLDERWEAIEEAERQYRATTRRVATDNIALARLPEGLELVRIGRPLRPEFAAWRYGDQFGRRRRRAWGYGAGTVAVSVASSLSPLGVTIGLGFGAVGLFQAAYYGLQWHHMRTSVVQVHDADGRSFRLSRSDLSAARLFVSPYGSPVLTLHVQRWGAAEPWLARLGMRERLHFGIAEIVLRGDSVQPALAALLPALNSAGGKPAIVEQAVRVIEESGSTTRLLHLAHTGPRRKILFHRPERGSSGADLLRYYPTAVRLAMEMALHEDDERRAMAGELGALYARWEDAERVAKISDRLLVDPPVQRRRIAALAVEWGFVAQYLSGLRYNST